MPGESRHAQALVTSAIPQLQVSSATCLMTSDSKPVNWLCAAADYLFAWQLLACSAIHMHCRQLLALPGRAFAQHHKPAFSQMLALAFGHSLTATLIQLQESAKKVQKRLINKQRHPAQLAADVVVLRTGAEPYLETMQHKLSLWQLSLLDVQLCSAAVASLVIVLALCVVALVVRLCIKGIQAKALSRRWREHQL